MEAKQKAISEAYGEYFELLKIYIDNDGWTGYYDEDNKELIKFLEEECNIEEINGYDYWRPKPLNGIENNNGWLDITISDKLNKEEVWLTDMEAIWKGYLYTQFSNQRLNENATHYQPIQTPNPPIY